MMTDPTPTPGTPVPPAEFIKETLRESRAMGCPERYAANAFAAWGHAQAMQEREALAEFLYALAWFIGGSPLEGALDMEASTRNWAERLRGGGSDG